MSGGRQTKKFAQWIAGRYQHHFVNLARRATSGLAGRLVLFVLALICVAVTISSWKVRTTRAYVIDREKVDLQDESRNLKLQFQLELQNAMSRWIVGSQDLRLEFDPSVAEPIRRHVLDHFSIDPSADRSAGQVETEPRRDDFRIHRAFVSVTDPDRREPLPEYPVWNGAVWHADRFCIEMLVAIASPAAAESNAGESESKLLRVRFDLSPLVASLTTGSRGLAYVVSDSRTDPSVLVSPNGNPQAIADTDSESRAENGPNTIPPRAILAALEHFRRADDGVFNVDRFGVLHAPEHSRSWWQIVKGDIITEGNRIEDVLTDENHSVLTFAESTSIGEDLFAKLRNERTETIERSIRSIDPYFRIDNLLPTVGRIRLRASSEHSLSAGQRLVTHYVQEQAMADGGADAGDVSLDWEEVEMDRFVFSVQRLTYPSLTSSDADAKPNVFGYLIRSTALTEIDHSASRDLAFIETLKLWTALLAMLVTVAFAWWLARPLGAMKRVAHYLSESRFRADDASRQQLEELLAELPTNRTDEIGTLAVQMRRTSKDLMDAHQKIQRSASEMIAQQRRNEQTEREKAIASKVTQDRERLLTQVSHDMRTPLGPIFHSVSKLLGSAQGDPKRERGLTTIHRNAKRLQYMIEDLLDFGRVMTGKIRLKNRSVQLDILLNDLIELHRGEAGSNSTEIVSRLNFAGEITVDDLRLERVVNNLLSNAVKATHDGTITVASGPLGTDRVEISIADTGCGMDALQQELVFKSADQRAEIERQRGRTTRRNDSSSTGMGLFIAKQMTEAMGGEIAFRSEPDRGTTFTLRLPVEAGHADVPLSTKSFENRVAPTDTAIRSRLSNESPSSSEHLASAEYLASAEHPASAATSATNRGGTQTETRSGGNDFAVVEELAMLAGGTGPTALVIDDDSGSIEVLRQMLADMGYRCIAAENGTVGLRKARESRPDLITLDVFMPGMDGWEVLQRLKDDPATADIPVVMVTVDANTGKASMLGAEGFLQKPVQSSELFTALDGLLDPEDDPIILLVDDDEACLEELRRSLAPLSGRVLTARDGVEALSYIHDLDGQRLSLAIIDLYMPNLDGFGLMEKMTSMPETRDVPVVVLSGGVLSQSERMQLEPHVDHFFSKGNVDLSQMQREVTRLIGRRSKRNASGSTVHASASP